MKGRKTGKTKSSLSGSEFFSALEYPPYNVKIRFWYKCINCLITKLFIF